MKHYFHNPSLEHMGELGDGRNLTLAIEFYEFEQDTAVAFVKDNLNFLSEKVHSGMISLWKCEGRTISDRKLSEKIITAITEGMGAEVSFEGYLPTQEYSTSSSIMKYRGQLRRIMRPAREGLPDLSIDFEDYWASLFKDNMFPKTTYDEKKISECVWTLFREKGKYLTSARYGPDTSGFLGLSPYRSHPSSFYGSMKLSVSSFGVGRYVDEIAELFVEHLTMLSEKYVQLNGRVMLQPPSISPGASPYMDYFGSHLNSDGSNIEVNQSPVEWYRTYYLPAIEWANIISPRVNKRISFLDTDIGSSTGVLCKKYKNGSILLKNKNVISNYCIEDALKLKEMVREVLYPGSTDFSIKQMLRKDLNSFQLSSFPRHNWAIVPILRDEICIIGSRLVFRSKRVI